jgi:hypothetical protein
LGAAARVFPRIPLPPREDEPRPSDDIEFNIRATRRSRGGAFSDKEISILRQMVRQGYSGSDCRFRINPAVDPSSARNYLQHVPTAMNRDSQDTPEVRV